MYREGVEALTIHPDVPAFENPYREPRLWCIVAYSIPKCVWGSLQSALPLSFSPSLSVLSLLSHIKVKPRERRGLCIGADKRSSIKSLCLTGITFLSPSLPSQTAQDVFSLHLAPFVSCPLFPLFFTTYFTGSWHLFFRRGLLTYFYIHPGPSVSTCKHEASS